MITKKLLAPSILSADLARLGESVQQVMSAGADWVHVDVMDNHYVPNLTFGSCIVDSLRRFGIRHTIDVHLMVEPVDNLVTDFAKAGADYISFHPEASQHVDRTLALIHESGCKAGLALNPATSPSVLEYVLDKLDYILVMSVNPGFGGQQFIQKSLEKIKSVRKLCKEAGYSIPIQVDGGVKLENITEISSAGADIFVAGSAIFGAANPAHAVTEFKKILQVGAR